MRTGWLIALVLWSGCAAAQTLEYGGDKDWEQVCKAATAQPLANEAPGGPLRGDALAHCDETALYYGFGKKPDYAAALQCGWWQRAHPQSASGNMFYGPGVLAMLYANGRGVARDEQKALRLVCEESWAAPAENESRVGHVEALRAAKTVPAEPFDMCDDITSGLSMGFCTSIQTRAGDAKRDVKIKAIVAELPAEAKAQFPALQAAESAFEDVRTRNEVDLSGTARAMFALDDEAKLRDQFLINLQRFGKGDVPAASPADLKAAVARLDAAYARLQTLPAKDWQSTTVTLSGVQDTERKWVVLRDAWIAFAKVAYPGLSEDRVRMQLIRLRAHQLEVLPE